MPVSAAGLRERFPAFADITRYPDAVVELCITEAESMVSSAFFPDATRRDLAVAYYVAHLLLTTATSSGVGGTAGIQSMTVGPVSVSYGSGTSASGGNDELMSTPYGRQYLKLCRAQGGLRVV